MDNEQKYLRRTAAAGYLKDRFGFGTVQTLAKLASIGGGPIFQKYGRYPVYTYENLDAWAAARMSVPLMNTSMAGSSPTNLLANASVIAIGATA